jgi:WD40 repeat protein
MPHKETVHGVVFGPGGEWLLAWSERGTLQSWQTLDGTPLNTLAGPSDGILALAISPDKERLALACRDRTVRLLTYPAGKELLALPTDAFLAPALNFRPDGQELTAATANGVRRWHVSTPP